MKKANTADRFLKIMDSHDMFQTLEKELGSAVRRLENQRIQQKDESSLLLRDLRRSQEEGEELKQKLIVAEKSLELHQEEEKAMVDQFSGERSSLERRLAVAEASLKAARESERHVMEHAMLLDKKITSSRVNAKSNEDTIKLNIDLRDRVEQQAAQMELLRDKVTQLSKQLQDLTKERSDLMLNNDKLLHELEAANERVDDRDSKLEVLQNQILSEGLDHDRLAACKESLASSMRLNATREKQISMLQEALSQQKAHQQRREDLRRESELLLETEMENLRMKYKEAEELRMREATNFNKQLHAQRDHTLRMSQALASLESQRSLGFKQEQSFRRSMNQSSTLRGNINDSKVVENIKVEEEDDNRVIDKALLGIVTQQHSDLNESYLEAGSWELSGIRKLQSSDSIVNLSNSNFDSHVVLSDTESFSDSFRMSHFSRSEGIRTKKAKKMDNQKKKRKETKTNHGIIRKKSPVTNRLKNEERTRSASAERVSALRPKKPTTPIWKM